MRKLENKVLNLTLLCFEPVKNLHITPPVCLYCMWHRTKNNDWTINYFTGSGCDGQTKTIDLYYATQDGPIYSPGYPYNYGNDEKCQWLIHAQSFERVLIYFTAFDLEYSTHCSNDSVQIFDGQNSWDVLLLKSCGSSLPPPVYSSDEYIYMQFTSDRSVPGKGFVARYRSISSYSGRSF